MKRQVSTIKQYDYSGKEEFEKHRKEMQKRGYFLIENGMFKGALDPQELQEEEWKFTAAYIKSPYM